jgi:hypothetical protein
MGRAFTDRWGAPVQARNDLRVVLFGESIEGLAAPAGGPVAGTGAVTTDDDLSLGHLYQTWFLVVRHAAEGAAAGILKRLTGPANGRASVRSSMCGRPGSCASDAWEAATCALECALLRDPGDLLALKVAQDFHRRRWKPRVVTEVGRHGDGEEYESGRRSVSEAVAAVRVCNVPSSPTLTQSAPGAALRARPSRALK